MKLTDEQRDDRDRNTAKIIDGLVKLGLPAMQAYYLLQGYLVSHGVPLGIEHVRNMTSRGRKLQRND